MKVKLRPGVVVAAGRGWLGGETMPIRTLTVLVLLVFAGVTPQPAQAQAQAPQYDFFYQCVSKGGSDEPEYRATPFTVRGDHAPSPEVLDAWKAVLRGKGLLHSDYDARCDLAYAGALDKVQSYMKRRPGLRYETVSWMPDFGAPFEMPREVYYYCVESEQGLQRRFVTDLFKAPMPEDLNAYLEEAYRKHERWLYSQNERPYSTNAGCGVMAPEPFQAYARMLDGMSKVDDPDRPYRPVHSAWPGVDPAAAPNLIDDLVARAKYAKMSIAPPPKTAKAAPPPTKPKAAPTPPKGGALIIEENTSAKDAQKRREEMERQLAKQDADRKVKIAALKAKADAEFKVKMDAFWAQRRKQGNAQ